MNKIDFMNSGISKIKALVQKAPTYTHYRVALAEMLIFVGRYDEAESQLDWLAKAQPDNKELRSLRNQLAVLSRG